eukprot:TRINITY_DN5255_c0_g1_i1.p3 TRINITY_DN5255_c0_g1~~TRINITY_DN5255_c0_g1_i1.p3  ORF type:complete len:145 (-),score=30.78 TRINITY_DN5255_c0_g1_i1:27-461(-)
MGSSGENIEDITIPARMIEYEDGTALLHYARDSDRARIQLSVACAGTAGLFAISAPEDDAYEDLTTNFVFAEQENQSVMSLEADTMIGLRFFAIRIPRGATMKNCYLTVAFDRVQSNTKVRVQMEKSFDADEYDIGGKEDWPLV